MMSKSLKISSALARGQHGVVLDDVEVRVQPLEHDLGGVDLELADGGRRVDDLALQVGGVDRIEVDQAERADAGGGEIERERRAEAAGADAEDLGGLELLLAFIADLGQDEVAGVAGDLFVGELRQFAACLRGWRWSWFPCRDTGGLRFSRSVPRPNFNELSDLGETSGCRREVWLSDQLQQAAAAGAAGNGGNDGELVVGSCRRSSLAGR